MNAWKYIGLILLLQGWTTYVTGQECEGSLGPNLFTAGDFGSGIPFALSQDPGYAPGYVYVTNGPPNDGQYIITNDMSKWAFVYGTWLVERDNSSDPNGYMMVVNASFEPGLFYEETITELCDNTLFEFSADIINMIRNGVNDHSDPNIDFLIDDEVVLRTGNIPKNERWNKYSFSFSTAPGQTSVKLSLRNNAPGGTGNDLGLDNISFRACGPLGTITSVTDSIGCIEDVPLQLTALLDGEEDPTRRYQWEVSQDVSSPWEAIADADSSSIELTTVAPGSKRYRFSSAASAESFDNEKCRFNSEEFDFLIPQRVFRQEDTLCGGTSIPFGDDEIRVPGLYVLELIAATGCDSIVEILIDTVRRETLTGEVELINPGCFGLSNGQVIVTNVQGGYPPYNIEIETQRYQGLIATDRPSGLQELAVKDRFGCFFNQDILLNDPPEFVLDIGPDVDVILGDEVIIDAFTSQSISDISWSETLSQYDGQTEFTFLPVDGGRITATAIADGGCTDTDTLDITLTKEVNLYVPNAFSPNGDFINDQFFASSYGRSLSHITTFNIYDRWGNEIWGFTDVERQSTNDQAWDGNSGNGTNLRPGVYTYRLEAVLIDDSVIERVGTVTLVE